MKVDGTAPGGRGPAGSGGGAVRRIRLGPTLPHDLVHSVVEDELGLEFGFWGLVSAGAKLQSVQAYGARDRGASPHGTTPSWPPTPRNSSPPKGFVADFSGSREPDRRRRWFRLAARALTRQYERVPLTRDDFVERVLQAVPETQHLVEEHLRDEGGLLLHILMADVRQFIIGVFQQGDDQPLVNRCLAFIDQALREGDSYVENAVAVSFVEDTGISDPAMKPFVDAWPDALRAEATSQREWKPEKP